MLKCSVLAGGQQNFVRKKLPSSPYSAVVSFLSLGGKTILLFAIIIIIFIHNNIKMASAKVSIETRPLGGHHDVVVDRTTITTETSWFDISMISAPPTWPMIGGFHDDSHHYNWKISTEENYRSNEIMFFGKFGDIRRRLDLNYHSVYTRSRQLLQDAIIESMLNSTSSTTSSGDEHRGSSCSSSSSEQHHQQQQQQPWIIFTAGVMGAGKTHTIKQLHNSGQFPLESFVTVDPDEMRRLLPEFYVYVDSSPELAGEFTRKEAGMMAEILTVAALERGQNVLVDGSLRDAPWYQKYFSSLRRSYPQIKLGIIHVTAPTEAIFERVKQRAKSTGRVVPTDVLLKSIEQVPKSVSILKREVDFFLEIHNPAEEGAPLIFLEKFQRDSTLSSSSSSSSMSTSSTTTTTMATKQSCDGRCLS